VSGSCVLRQEITRMANDRAVGTQPDRVTLVFDDKRVVADTGVLLPATLAARRGVEALG
jgi:hypothetical protein